MKLSKFSIKKYREIIYKYTLVNLNLRLEKSTGGNIIATIPKGTKVEVEFEDEEWIKVKYNSQEGYAYKYYYYTAYSTPSYLRGYAYKYYYYTAYASYYRYKYAYPRKYDTVKYSMMNMPNREIEKYVSCKRSQISKNFTHFQNYCKDLAVKEGIIC